MSDENECPDEAHITTKNKTANKKIINYYISVNGKL